MNKEDEIKWGKIFDSFLSNTNSNCYSSKSVITDMMQAACYIVDEKCSNMLRSKAITVLYEIAFLDSITIEECWEIYWIINRTTFSNAYILLLKGNIRLLYTHIFIRLKNALDMDFSYQMIDSRDHNSIIITTNQFLSINHAPTIRVLDYSYTIQKNFNKKITIINTSELNFHKHKHLETDFSFSFLDNYSGTSKITYKGEEFEFYQVSERMPNLEIYRKLITIIHDIRPLMIYNIGASNLLSDLCSEFTATASLPCSYDIPISCSRYLLVARKIDSNDQEVLNYLSKDQVIIETNFNYVDDADTTVYSREDFGLESDSFIGCIVGNRLDSEIDDEFIDFLKKVIDTTDIHIVFIGIIEDQKRITGKMGENRYRVHFLGYQQHAKAIISLTDLYINPKRKGGGRSCFEALTYGIPVITPNMGDVYYACKGTISATNYMDMYSSIIECYTNQDYYNDMSYQASLRATELSDIINTQKDVLDSILAHELHKKD